MQAAQEKLTAVSVSPAQGEPYTRLPQAIVKGIISPFCSVVDLVLLSVILVYLALSASGIQHGDKLLDLLTIRLSVEHFAVVMMCWIIWRATFCYCGLYTSQHVRSLEGVAGR